MKNLSRKTGKKFTVFTLCVVLVALFATNCEKLRELRVNELVDSVYPTLIMLKDSNGNNIYSKNNQMRYKLNANTTYYFSIYVNYPMLVEFSFKLNVAEISNIYSNIVYQICPDYCMYDYDFSLNDLYIAFMPYNSGYYIISLEDFNGFSVNLSSNMMSISDKNFNKTYKLYGTQSNEYEACNIYRKSDILVYLTGNQRYYIYFEDIFSEYYQLSIISLNSNTTPPIQQGEYLEIDNGVYAYKAIVSLNKYRTNDVFNLYLPIEGDYTIKFEGNNLLYTTFIHTKTNNIIHMNTNVANHNWYYEAKPNDTTKQVIFGFVNNFDYVNDIEVIVYCNPNYNNSFIVIDPQNMLPYSSEITINNGQFGSTIITKGFTRNLFININGTNQSRLDYTFTSSNQHVAMVSIYGTVQGTNKGTALITVKNKIDLNIVSHILIIVVEQPQPLIIHPLTIKLDNNIDPQLNGTEYKILGNTNPLTFNIIHKYYTRSICIFGGPSPIRQDYNFFSSDYNIASVDCWGFIHGVNPGIATITITNRYAPNFIGYVEVEIVV